MERKIEHGCKQYDQELQAEIHNQKHLTSQLLASQLQMTAKGGEVASEEIVGTTSEFIQINDAGYGLLLNTGLNKKPEQSLLDRCRIFRHWSWQLVWKWIKRRECHLNRRSRFNA